MSSFKDNIKKVKGKRHSKIKNSYGCEDYQIFYNRKHNKKIKLSLFSKILRDCINQIIDEHLMKYLTVRLPSKMGELHIEKFSYKPRQREDGTWMKIVPVDWGKTLELWENDTEAKENKILVKYDIPYYHTLLYETNRWDFYNHQFYKLKTCRSLNKRIHQELTLNNKFKLWQSNTYQ